VAAAHVAAIRSALADHLKPRRRDGLQRLPGTPDRDLSPPLHLGEAQPGAARVEGRFDAVDSGALANALSSRRRALVTFGRRSFMLSRVSMMS